MLGAPPRCDRDETSRVRDLRQRVRAAMERPPVRWTCPAAIDPLDPAEPVAIRRARAIALKLAAMPTDLWDGQLLAGSMTLEEPRLHAEWGFPEYLTESERESARRTEFGFRPSFGHIVPDYPKLLRVGLRGIIAEACAAENERCSDAERAFLASVRIACDAACAYAARLAEQCDRDAAEARPARAAELRQMAANLRVAPAGPAQTFQQALQAVWVLHLLYHSTGDGNALGRVDQYVWPFLEADLRERRLTLEAAGELVDCFCLKFNERAVAAEEQRTEHRLSEAADLKRRTRHGTSSQVGSRRDSLDAANHWLQNIVIGGLTPAGEDGTNPLSHLLLESYHRHQMTNPLLTARLHRGSPKPFVAHVAEVLRGGGGMPAIFNDEALVPALEKLGLPTADARDYTNDGCWEVIIPGRTDFCFQRLSLMLCLEWALNHGRPRIEGMPEGLDLGEPQALECFEAVYAAWAAQLDHLIAGVVERVASTLENRARYHPVPLLSALIDGTIEHRRDLAAGGARHQTFGMLAESVSHCIDSLAAIRDVVFEQGATDMRELCAALEADFVGHELLRKRLQRAPKYGNDDPATRALGRRVMSTFVELVRKHAARFDTRVLWPCGGATFSWYVGIGEGLGASPDGRRAGEPVASNLSPSLGRDVDGLFSTVLAYADLPHEDLAAGGPLDLRVPASLVAGEQGAERLAGLLRGFVQSGGSMLTVTVADAETLRAAQREPEQYSSLRVRMGGWCAYFTLLSPEQQEHQIRRQEQLG